ncbi:MAG: hypothetical protein JXA25_14085 [Anaerolineales bacterium]|nr:hypothetical protein [Anaerolineales bacterium]
METIYPEDLILVAIIPSPRDLEIARVLGWYRIPLQSAPRTVRVDWIAFYQPGIFGPERWSIRMYARVEGVELVSRWELLQEEQRHPRANEPYYKIQLGPMQRLEKPILAVRWHRFTFLYTTGERFLQARTIEALRIRSVAERNSLLRSLRERAAGSGSSDCKK